jgi:sodium/hydrogen exchanger 8
MKKARFFANFTTITLYAVVGTLVSTFIIGGLVYACARAGVVSLNAQHPLEAFIFGALLSATDPVATLAIIGAPELNCEPMLYSLVFGESVLNDAVAITLFETFLDFSAKGEDLTLESFPLLMLKFVGISVGSILIGLSTGLLTSLAMRRLPFRDYHRYEIGLLFITAFGTYAAGEAAGLSGIMALFFSGVVLSHYNYYNLSDTSKISSTYVFESFASVAETLVFAYMGASVASGEFSVWQPSFCVLAILFCLLARAFNTFPLTALANIRRKRKIPMRMQFVIWFAGLRGAVAFALSMTFPGPNREVVVTTTLCVVIFTTFTLGGLTEPVLGWSGMKRLPDAAGRRRSSGAGAPGDGDGDAAGGDAGLEAAAGGVGGGLSGEDSLTEVLNPYNPVDGEGEAADAAAAAAAAPSAGAAAGGAPTSLSAVHSSGAAAAASQIAVALDAPGGEGRRLPAPPPLGSEGRATHVATGMHRAWRGFDDRVMKPIFGGQGVDSAAPRARQLGMRGSS